MPQPSDTSAPKRVVAEGYDQVAEAYAQLERGTTWPCMRWLEKLLALLPAPAAILELGCSSGASADIALAHQHHVTGVDIAAAQIARIRQNVPTGTFLHADLATVPRPRRKSVEVTMDNRARYRQPPPFM